MSYTEKQKKLIFRKGNIIEDKNKNLYRTDAYGKIMYFLSYGKHTEMGWQIDHIIPLSRGGSNEISNLQPLNSYINESKGGSLKKRDINNHKK